MQVTDENGSLHVAYHKCTALHIMLWHRKILLKLSMHWTYIHNESTSSYLVINFIFSVAVQKLTLTGSAYYVIIRSLWNL